MAEQVRVIAVVDWRRQRVHGFTHDHEEARQWCRNLIDRYDDPLAATVTAGLINVPEDAQPDHATMED